MQSCRFPSMAGAAWKSTCFASRRTSPSSLTADSTWATCDGDVRRLAKQVDCHAAPAIEVDLRCATPRVAAERDGRQHLGGAAALRRGRRKGSWLREHGYRVLRFLAGDVPDPGASAALYPCDDLAGRLQRRPGAVCRQARWR